MRRYVWAQYSIHPQGFHGMVILAIPLATLRSLSRNYAFFNRLRSTFLYVRVQKNPYYYKLEANSREINIEKILESKLVNLAFISRKTWTYIVAEDICLKHLSSLASSNIIQMHPDEDMIGSTSKFI